MFMLKQDKDKLRDTLAEIKAQQARQSNGLSYLSEQIARIQAAMKYKILDNFGEEAPHGYKKDGTPRAKPGRKPGVKA